MGLISQTRTAVANRLLALPYFEDIPIEPLKPKETTSELANRINKLSLAGTVIIPRLSGMHPNVHGVYFDEIEVQVGFCENRKTNTTGKDCEDVAEQAAVSLHMWKPDHLDCPLAIDKPTIVEIPPENESDRSKRLLAVRLIARGGIAVVLPQVATPQIANNSGTITLTCATPGAAMFWRVDGKQPNPRVGSGSTLYTAPFTPGAGVLKARAFLAGFEDSVVAQLTL
ncbi:MAG TPA: chitobiase/beta-hexosaminidase C-terminal domain-containing protein [Verrucomicrobiae bacterium]